MSALKAFADRCVGGMTPISSTVSVVGGLVKRHPSYAADERPR